ncbi:MAG TPA: isoprenylcysteine carboxylmethyltransferase family protein [Anaerolineales bacterium]|nr:isoprenylcysteine carboxylmethyltransferase family protein [Anaerolineales bacterium]
MSGPYRYVRNPMYLSGMILLLGEAIYFRSAFLQVYMGVFSAAFHTFVVRYEEPHLRQRFGAEYERYLASVPRWGPSVKLFKLG